MKRREDGVRITLAIHHVDSPRPACQQCFGGLDPVSPANRLAAVVRLAALGFRLCLVQPKDGLDVEEAKRPAGAIGCHRKREVTEEPLPGADEPAEPLPLLLSPELELGGVVDHQHPGELGRALGGLPEVGREDRLRRQPLVAEEAVRRLELGIVERLRKAHPGRSGNGICQQAQAPIQPLVAQLRACQLLGRLRRIVTLAASHPGRGSRP